jgi:hypothetical protein
MAQSLYFKMADVLVQVNPRSSWPVLRCFNPWAGFACTHEFLSSTFGPLAISPRFSTRSCAAKDQFPNPYQFAG